eukprot:3427234-Rhodomonas_salina.3
MIAPTARNATDTSKGPAGPLWCVAITFSYENWGERMVSEWKTTDKPTRRTGKAPRSGSDCSDLPSRDRDQAVSRVGPAEGLAEPLAVESLLVVLADEPRLRRREEE